MKTTDELKRMAEAYQPPADLPTRFDETPYTRIPLSRDDEVEAVLICLAPGQTSSVHHHQRNNCAVRVVRGKALENLFGDDGDDLTLVSCNFLLEGDVSALDGEQVHQLCNLSKRGTVLVNFYSPPFK